MSITRILELSSPIYQMEWNGRMGILLVAALKSYAVCYTLKKTFYEMKKKRKEKTGTHSLNRNRLK